MARKKIKKKSKNNFLNKIKFSESYTSFILGATVVLIVGIILISFAKVNKYFQTSSIQNGPVMESQDTSSTYTIKPGDDLWNIAENIYKDGFKWVEIAKVNKLEDPGIIHTGNKLIIPTITPTITEVPQQQNEVMQNNSITGNVYKIKAGDNLWDISVRAYGDGFKWPEITKANNLENPDLIFSDNILQIPR